MPFQNNPKRKRFVPQMQNTVEIKFLCESFTAKHSAWSHHTVSQIHTSLISLEKYKCNTIHKRYIYNCLQKLTAQGTKQPIFK